MLLNKAVSTAFMAEFDSNESTLFKAIRTDVAAEANDPLAMLLIVVGLVVALAFAALVFMTRQLGILVFVCMAPLVLALLARGGDTTAVKKWAMRLLGLLFAPFALLLISPFVALFSGSVAMDLVFLVAADALMLRMIFHGVPYIGPGSLGLPARWWSATPPIPSPGPSFAPGCRPSTSRRTHPGCPAPWTPRAGP
ncbi:hypothetical protein GCM10010271_71520 [Streptomyces kurssanovii]|nr:hypothetical protein GCM10010271_71520 [Streptomyces kurssanovii]